LTSEEAERPVPGNWPGATFFVEFEHEEACPLTFSGNPTVVLFFISWAYSVRFGGTHELAQGALRMQRRHKVDLRPLLTFADRTVEDDDDQFALDHAWQEAAPLEVCCKAVVEALESDDAELRASMGAYEHALMPRLRELAEMCAWGALHRARVRLSFTLDG
jgi:hypothetical protein